MQYKRCLRGKEIEFFSKTLTSIDAIVREENVNLFSNLKV